MPASRPSQTSNTEERPNPELKNRERPFPVYDDQSL